LRALLWFDNDPKTEIATKIQRAASYYRDKYGQLPTLCFVHPSMISQGETKEEKIYHSGLEVRTSQSVLPNHFWIGVNGKSSTQ